MIICTYTWPSQQSLNWLVSLRALGNIIFVIWYVPSTGELTVMDMYWHGATFVTGALCRIDILPVTHFMVHT